MTSSRRALTDPVGGPVSKQRKADLRTGRVFWLDLAVFFCLLVLGAASLPIPFGGDQGLNLLIGQLIAEGGAPYRDVWDLKHPGVFLFFAAAGALFGFNEIGIHVFELLWMLTLALLVRVVAGRWLDDRASASLAPVLTVGLYYAVASPFHLTQTEAIVGLPLLACLWCTVEASRVQRGTRAWLAGSGLAAGIVAVFKLPYLALAITFWLLAIRDLKCRGVGLRHAVITSAPWIVAGVLIPVVATVAFLFDKGVAALAFWTFFKHPVEVASVIAPEPRRLLYAIRFWIVSTGPALALATIGMADALRRRMDLMTTALSAWLVIGVLLIVTQAISWWEYHFFLLLVPVGLLATRGVERAKTLLTSWLKPSQYRLGRTVGALALMVCFVPQLGAATRTAALTWSSRPLPFSREGLAAFQDRYYADYGVIRARTAFLREPGSHPGPIYVIDTPIYYVHAGRMPAIPLLIPWFHPTDRLWRRWLSELKMARPCYIRVSPWALQAIVDDRPSLRKEVARIVPLIESRYERLRSDDGGTWYLRRDLGPGR
jgi:hypothetical protein